MSLRPAQQLVAESSKFSLRQFFDTPSQLPLPEPVAEGASATSALPVAEVNSPTSQPQQFSFQSIPAQQMPFGNFSRAPAPTQTIPKEAKFTFNGLMPTTTSSQLQHRLLAQHQQTSIQSGASRPSAPANDASDVLRLKAQVVTLNDRIAHLNTNLASTSESVVRGNKALTTERAQFHSMYAAITKKLEATSAALAEAGAFPKEAIKNAKLLNAKILELQEENAQLSQTRATLEQSLGAKGAELEVLRATAETVDVELQSKYEVLSAQHSLALSKQAELNESLETHQSMLEAASAEVTAFDERLEASKIETATADGLVEELDAKLSALRLELETKAEQEAAATAAACCERLARCEALEKAAEEARDKMHGAAAADCEWLAEEHHFAQCVAKRARAHLEHGGSERVMVAHVFTDDSGALDEAEACLDACVRHNPLPMGSPYEQSFQLARVGLNDAAANTGAAAENGAQSAMSLRTSAFVKAISEDLKFHMDGSQALYRSSSATGVALEI
jgi:hypothetical protein